LEEAWAPEYAYIGIIIDVDAIEKLQVRSIVEMLLFRYLPIESLARTYPRRRKMGDRWSQEAQN